MLSLKVFYFIICHPLEAVSCSFFSSVLSKILIGLYCRLSYVEQDSLMGALNLNSHNAREIKKRSFISTVWPTVHTNPSRKRSFSKTLFKPEESKNTTAFCFRLDGKHFENGVVFFFFFFF